MKKLFTIFMIMVMVLTGTTPTVTEAKTTKTSITVTNKSTDKKIGKKLTLTQGKKLQLKVKYGKTNVTKKAKYKASNKNVTISKKGKITAKKVGATTVTIKYKKKTKKIKVTVKAKVVQATTEQATTEQATTEAQTAKTKLEKFEEDRRHVEDANPNCSHEWFPVYTSGDVRYTGFVSSDWKDHITLAYLECSKCGERAEVSDHTITATEGSVRFQTEPTSDGVYAKSYAQSALTSLITVYIPSSSFSKAPKHKCHFQWYYTQLSDGSWSPTHDCLICGDGDF